MIEASQDTRKRMNAQCKHLGFVLLVFVAVHEVCPAKPHGRPHATQLGLVDAN
jgi:hypothetical protein